MSEERGKCYLYGQADVPIFEEVWLICNASAHYTLGRKGRGPNGCKREFYVQFFLILPGNKNFISSQQNHYSYDLNILNKENQNS